MPRRLGSLLTPHPSAGQQHHSWSGQEAGPRRELRQPQPSLTYGVDGLLSHLAARVVYVQSCHPTTSGSGSGRYMSLAMTVLCYANVQEYVVRGAGPDTRMREEDAILHMSRSARHSPPIFLEGFTSDSGRPHKKVATISVVNLFARPLPFALVITSSDWAAWPPRR